MSARILVVEDEAELNHAIVAGLSARGHHASGVRSVAEARGTLESEHWDAAVVDVQLPDGEGIDLLQETRRRRPSVPVIVMTGFPSIDRAVMAMKLGAIDYLAKPFEDEELAARLQRLLTPERGLDPPKGAGFARIVGRSAPIVEAIESARRVARSDASTVLLTGESGTGKDLLARAIHEEGRRAGAPFMNVTCTAIADQLFESELFGHEKGSFTGAQGTKRGLLELAHGGTVFLDEVGDMPASLQGKLLRFLQDKSFKRVGGGRDITVDVRVIAATNQRLADRIAAGTFRTDLYHRLKVVDIELPPLRRRGDDIELLACTFVAEMARAFDSTAEGFTPDALESLRRHPWPGNVRELRNVVERGLILGRERLIGRNDLPSDVRASEARGSSAAPLGPAPTIAGEADASGRVALPAAGVDLEKLERDLLLAAVARSAGNKTAAARLLGLNRDQVRYRLKKYRTGPDAPSAGV